MLGSYNFYNNAFPIIYISFLLTVPIPSVELNKIRNNTSKALVIPIMVVFILSYIYSFNFQKNSNNVAYLHHGVWALASEAYDLNNLRNSTSYSYSEFVKLLQADTISSIENIKSYDELWIVTPTTPFSQKEISDIKIEEEPKQEINIGIVCAIIGAVLLLLLVILIFAVRKKKDNP
jgi:hypothetical protein